CASFVLVDMHLSTSSLFPTRRSSDLTHIVNMIFNKHQVSRLKIFINTTCRICYNDGLNSKILHYANRKSNLLHGIPFIIMKSSLHRDHLFPLKYSNHKLSFMPCNG